MKILLTFIIIILSHIYHGFEIVDNASHTYDDYQITLDMNKILTLPTTFELRKMTLIEDIYCKK